MTNTQYNPASVEKFFVFCPKLGPTEETEHEKILFYFPTETPLNKQQTDVGLGEGIINFVKYWMNIIFLNYSNIHIFSKILLLIFY